MIRFGALGVGLSLAALWVAPLAPAVLDVPLRSLSAGLLTASIVFLAVGRPPACPTCAAALRVAQREPAPAPAGDDGEHDGEHDGDVELDEPEPENARPTGALPVPDGAALARPYVDPWATVPLPVVRP